MQYRLIYLKEDNREELYKTLSEISVKIEGVDWMSGIYSVFDESGTEYEAQWIERATESKSFLGIGYITVGSYKLVPKRICKI